MKGTSPPSGESHAIALGADKHSVWATDLGGGELDNPLTRLHLRVSVVRLNHIVSEPQVLISSAQQSIAAIFVVLF